MLKFIETIVIEKNAHRIANIISTLTITSESKFSSFMNVKVKGVTQLRS